MTSTPLQTNPRHRTAAVALALVAGAALLVAFGWPVLYWERQLAFLAVAAVASAVPWVRATILAALARLRRPRPKARARIALAVALAATLYLLATGVYQERDFFPRFHDEHMYLLQVRMLAQGRLWLPQHELADFFETTHVLVKPVYAAMYFPGAALMHLPTAWLGVPYWIGSAALSGCAAGLLYRVTAELIDGVAGALAAFLLIGLTVFRQLSLMVMSHTCMTVLGLAVVWAWLRWRDGRHPGWLLALGALSGWAAITRPIDAVTWVAPVGLALLLDTRALPTRRRLALLMIPVAAAAPFLALQVAFNVGVTGSPTKTPYALYLEQSSPQNLWRADGSAATRPATTLRQKLDYYDQFTAPAMRANTPGRMPAIWLRERFPLIARVTLPSTLLLLLLPLGLAALVGTVGGLGPRADAAVLAAPALLYVGLYATFAYLLEHYVVVIAPPIIFLVVLARHVLAGNWHDSRYLACTSVLGVVAVALPAFAELNWWVRDDLFVRPVMHFNHVELPKHVRPPAIVLYRYRTGAHVHEEPVYNIDVADPDDAPIIRAHDLGPQRNGELLRYYAARQPERTVYRFDRVSRTLERLGNVADLARREAAP